MEQSLPPGPDAGVLAQTVRLHRDPLGFLRETRERFGDVFTLRLATARPIVVVAAPEEVESLLDADPATARAGEARRRILPMASPRSVFGGDGEQHRDARERVAAAFRAVAIAGHRDAMVAIAARHVEGWPQQRPLRSLPRMRALVDDVFVRVLLDVGDDRRARRLTVAIRRMLWTPGNPPLSIPGEGDGLLGMVAAADFKRRVAPLANVGGHQLPAGVTVMLPIPLLHRDPRVYTEPDAFRPERRSVASASDRAFLPFGGGARRCLGEHLARVYLTALIPEVLRRRRLKPLTRDPERMVLRGTILVPRRSGLMRAVARLDDARA